MSVDDILDDVEAETKEISITNPELAARVASQNSKNNLPIYIDTYDINGLPCLAIFSGKHLKFQYYPVHNFTFLGCIVSSMGPYLQGGSFEKAFAPNGNFANFVDQKDYVRILEKARNISPESKAIGIASAKTRYSELYGEDLTLPKCLEVIAAHCCYLSCPFLSGLEREEVKKKMANLKLDIDNIKLIFDRKVSKYFDPMFLLLLNIML